MPTHTRTMLAADLLRQVGGSVIRHPLPPVILSHIPFPPTALAPCDLRVLTSSHPPQADPRRSRGGRPRSPFSGRVSGLVASSPLAQAPTGSHFRYGDRILLASRTRGYLGEVVSRLVYAVRSSPCTGLWPAPPGTQKGRTPPCFRHTSSACLSGPAGRCRFPPHAR